MLTTNKKNIIWIENTESTNSYGFNYINKNDIVKDITFIITQKQTAGKGQQNNKWESQDYKNLTFSIILKPQNINAGNQFLISQIVSLSVLDYLNQYIKDVIIKWPNDIYVKNKKISGILIEHLIMGMDINFSVCGVGINVNQNIFMSDAPNPISLNQITNKEYNLKMEIEKFYEIFENNLKSVYISPTKTNTRYLNNLLGYQKERNFIANSVKFKGRIIGITEFGQLIIEKKDGNIQHFAFKEVEFII